MTRSNVVPFPSRHDPADHVAESGENIFARAAQISVLAGFVCFASGVLLTQALLVSAQVALRHGKQLGASTCVGIASRRATKRAGANRAK